MNQYLESLSKNYVVFYVISLLDGSFKKVSTISDVDTLAHQFQDAQTLMNAVVKQSVYPEFQEKMLRFVDLSTIKERLKSENKISCEYYGRFTGWCNAQFIPVCHENNTFDEILFVVSHIQRGKLESEIYRHALEKNATFVLQFDLTTGILEKAFEQTVRKYVPDFPYAFPMTHDEFIGCFFDYVGAKPYKGEKIYYSATQMLEMYQEGISRFATQYYSTKLQNYYRHEFFLTKDESNEHIVAMVVGTNISSEVADEIKNTEQVADILSRDFHNVFWLNLKTDEAIPLKVGGRIAKILNCEIGKSLSYQEVLKIYVSVRVTDADRERFIHSLEPQEIVRQLETESTFSVVFQAFEEDGKEHTHRVKISRMDEQHQGDVVLMAFQNIDKFMEEERRNTQILRALSSEYSNVYLVNPYDDIGYAIKQTGYLPHGFQSSSAKPLIYTAIVDAYVTQRVYEKDQERVRAAFQPEQVIQALSKQKSFSVVYQVVEQDGLHDFQATMIRTKAEEEEEEEREIFVLGFQNIDAYVVEQRKQQRMLEESLKNKEQAIEAFKMSRIYMEAISASYEFVVVYNLTRNTYNTIINHHFLDFNTPTQGIYSEFVENIMSYFYEKDIAYQRKVRTMQSQVERYRSGKKYFEERHRAHDKKGNLHWIRERIVYMEDSNNGDMLGISISTIIDDEVARERKESQITTALTQHFKTVFLVNPGKDVGCILKHEGFMPEEMKLSKEMDMPYTESVKIYAESRLIKEDQERYQKELSFQNIKQRLANSDEFTVQIRAIENGEIQYYQVRVIKTDEEGVYILGFENIDEIVKEEQRKQKEIEVALEKANKANEQAQLANNAKSEFLARMSHDIRTPINGIVGVAHMMKADVENPANIKQSIKQIEQLAHQLELLIGDVLEMSRIENKKVELVHETFSLVDLMNGVAPAILAMANVRGVVLHTESIDFVHPFVVGSPVHLQRIVLNVLSNAVKYTLEGGHVTCFMREIPMDSMHSNFEFTVSDTGIGMSEDFVEHIFEPFAREQKTLDTSYKGTGLGMSITKEFVNLLGGTIEIKSQQGIGTTVRFTIPMEIGQEFVEEGQKVVISLANKHVLLVEDNQINLKFAKFILEEENAIVDVARNGQEAIEKFKSSPVGSYDLILMDVMMPVMDGLEATGMIRQFNREDAKKVPIVAMSANAFKEDVERCLQAGMNDHIAKPLNIETVMAKIARYV